MYRYTTAGAIEVWDVTTTDGMTTVSKLEGGHTAKAGLYKLTGCTS